LPAFFLRQVRVAGTERRPPESKLIIPHEDQVHQHLLTFACQASYKKPQHIFFFFQRIQISSSHMHNPNTYSISRSQLSKHTTWEIDSIVYKHDGEVNKYPLTTQFPAEIGDRKALNFVFENLTFDPTRTAVDLMTLLTPKRYQFTHTHYYDILICCGACGQPP
jgi:hypothetical protein